jgi:hypothetical protein
MRIGGALEVSVNLYIGHSPFFPRGGVVSLTCGSWQPLFLAAGGNPATENVTGKEPIAPFAVSLPQTLNIWFYTPRTSGYSPRLHSAPNPSTLHHLGLIEIDQIEP